MITISVNDEFAFISNVHDYIVELAKTTPNTLRFQSFADNNHRNKSIAYYLEKNNTIIEYFDCPLFDRGLHAHNIEDGKSFANDTITSTRCFRGHFYENSPIVFCTSVELAVIEYINQQLTLMPGLKHHLISTLHKWLPSCTFDCVKVRSSGSGSSGRSSNSNIQVHSYFEPTFITARYNIDVDCKKKYTTLDYYYYETLNHIDNYNIVYPEKSVHSFDNTLINCYRIVPHG